MKKIPLLFFCVIFLFSSCSSQPAPIARNFTANVTATCNRVKIRAKVTAEEHNLLTVNMYSPNALRGYTYTYKDGKLNLSSGNMNIDADENYLPPTAFVQVIYNVLSTIGQEDNCTVNGIYNSSVEYKGSCASGKYTLRSNFSTGAIESIKISSIGFSAAFKSTAVSK